MFFLLVEGVGILGLLLLSFQLLIQIILHILPILTHHQQLLINHLQLSHWNMLLFKILQLPPKKIRLFLELQILLLQFLQLVVLQLHCPLR